MQIRPATQADQPTITRLIHDVGINPMSLDWHRFLIAEESGETVGIGQIKQHGDGSRELASLAVILERRGQGIASEIIRALLEKEIGQVYLTCRSQLETFYNRFGFRTIGREEMTPYFRRLHRIGNIFAQLAGTRMLVMKKELDGGPMKDTRGQSSAVSRRVLLAVYAHPDDELSAGGTLAHYARQGVGTHLICATRGEVGEAPPDLKGFKSIAEMRSDELQCACNILGLDSVNFLGYRDSGMPGSPDNHHPQSLVAAPIDEVALKVAAFIRRLKPQAVVTFDPIGGYRHPDHIAIHKATVEAFRIAGDLAQDIEGLPPHAPQKLYFSTFPRGFLRTAVRVLKLVGRNPKRFGKNGDIDLEALVEFDFPIHARIPIGDVLDQKARATACHSSQLPSMGGALARWFQKLFAGEETFMRAVPSEPPTSVERDLFYGV